MEDSCNHVTNINKTLKSIKLEVTVNFICSDQSGVMIVTNKVVSPLDLQIIESYVESTKYIKAEGVEVLWLPQSKSYLKIIGISYIRENTNTPITSEVVEKIIKKSHIFNNIVLVSRSYIIKISPRSNMAIIWIDIWNIQSSNMSYASPLIQKYIPMVKSPPNHTSLPSIVATFLATYLMVVLQSSGYFVFHSRNTPIQLSLPWQSYSC